jgi:quercetin dioxygenase-like cupin family protein
MSDDCRDRLSIAGRALPPAFVRREVTVAPGAEHPYDPAEWRDALVVVERGEIELECGAGHLARFRTGDILWLTGLPLRVLRNDGPEPAVLVAVSRRGH